MRGAFGIKIRNWHKNAGIGIEKQANKGEKQNVREKVAGGATF